jgi:hypothetical protein
LFLFEERIVRVLIMKKLILITILLGFIAAPALAGPTFRFSQVSQVTGFGKLAGFTNDSDALPVTTYTDGTFGGTAFTQTYQVGLVASQIGESTATVGDRFYIGIGDSGFDLSSGFDAFAMTIANDNDDTWDYRLFADDGTTTVLGSSWTTLVGGGATANLTLTLPQNFGDLNLL